MPKPPSRKPSRSAPRGSEVVADPRHDRRVRRTFSHEDKVRILAEADACTERGALATLMRREGIYSSHLQAWRTQLERDGAGVSPPKPGPKPKLDAKDRQIAELERKQRKLEKELDLARKLIDLQVKAHEILGIALPRIEDE